ncbi:CGNR zinc finger domain-containing protein [Paraburkholderia sp. BL25I1N1]|uniref:CGNR zinc finger domain-containing protein n=1 Tax=Paraburkholderia sp. BL25I1N1 TaxID=1938804 RepID=UPI000D067965|nr:CGNR zinc finger domain-containing protein [Paraburkholderia sp. BL25I1N1]PRY04532.1 putative RNA-binding Zn ribbon-like protein [Paraburkholderia sp. BL25I1N1]
MADHNQTAPGELEVVRKFINTWSIPNDTRLETDALPELTRMQNRWSEAFPGKARSRTDTLTELQRLRSDLRRACQGTADGDRILNAWFRDAALVLRSRIDEGATRLTVEPRGTGFADYIVATVANAIASGEWSRLKTCPGCQWAFFDHTRNGGKRWCGMTKGGPDGRACGTIAKVAAYRAREAVKTHVG